MSIILCHNLFRTFLDTNHTCCSFVVPPVQKDFYPAAVHFMEMNHQILIEKVCLSTREIWREVFYIFKLGSSLSLLNYIADSIGKFVHRCTERGQCSNLVCSYQSKQYLFLGGIKIHIHNPDFNMRFYSSKVVKSSKYNTK